MNTERLAAIMIRIMIPYSFICWAVYEFLPSIIKNFFQEFKQPLTQHTLDVILFAFILFTVFKLLKIALEWENPRDRFVNTLMFFLSLEMTLVIWANQASMITPV